MSRMLRHLLTPRLLTRRRFSAAVLQAIEAAITAAERGCSGEIRFVVETALEPGDLRAGVTARERALQVFADLQVWNTELRNGVLIYMLMAERDVEIVADRGAAAAIAPQDWEGVCRAMEAHFREGRFAAGAVAGVEAVGRLLGKHFPGDRRDELPNQPSLL
jgi:uncharacterized membrane protein